MVGRCISYWISPFWGDMLVFGGVSDLVLPLWNIVLCGHVRCMVSKGEYLTSALAAKGFFSPSKNIVLPTSAGSPLKEFGKHWNTLVFTNIAGWNIPIFNRIQKFDSVRVHFQASYVSFTWLTADVLFWGKSLLSFFATGKPWWDPWPL